MAKVQLINTTTKHFIRQDEVKIWKTPALFDKAELESSELIQIADDDKVRWFVS